MSTDNKLQDSKYFNRTQRTDQALNCCHTPAAMATAISEFSWPI